MQIKPTNIQAPSLNWSDDEETSSPTKNTPSSSSFDAPPSSPFAIDNQENEFEVSSLSKRKKITTKPESSSPKKQKSIEIAVDFFPDLSYPSILTPPPAPKKGKNSNRFSTPTANSKIYSCNVVLKVPTETDSKIGPLATLIYNTAKEAQPSLSIEQFRIWIANYGSKASASVDLFLGQGNFHKAYKNTTSNTVTKIPYKLDDFMFSPKEFYAAVGCSSSRELCVDEEKLRTAALIASQVLEYKRLQDDILPQINQYLQNPCITQLCGKWSLQLVDFLNLNTAVADGHIITSFQEGLCWKDLSKNIHNYRGSFPIEHSSLTTLPLIPDLTSFLNSIEVSAEDKKVVKGAAALFRSVHDLKLEEKIKDLSTDNLRFDLTNHRICWLDWGGELFFSEPESIFISVLSGDNRFFQNLGVAYKILVGKEWQIQERSAT